MNTAVTNAHFTPDQIKLIDSRFLPFMKDWTIEETYKNQNVVIPDINPFNYYEVLDKPGETENEKQLSLWCGWTGNSPSGDYDAEVIINLRIDGKNALNQNVKKVSAEILRSGGAPMKVNFNNKLVTDFTQMVTVPVQNPGWFCPKTVTAIISNGYQTVDDMNTYL